jgi:hypothetical protein
MMLTMRVREAAVIVHELDALLRDVPCETGDPVEVVEIPVEDRLRGVAVVVGPFGEMRSFGSSMESGLREVLEVFSRQFLPAEAGDDVIVDHAHRLHVGVDDGASDEAKSALLQVAAHGVGCRGAGRDLLDSIPGVSDRPAAYP